MGAWIEIFPLSVSSPNLFSVAPYMGAWIEIVILAFSFKTFVMSHPSWVRGLK